MRQLLVFTLITFSLCMGRNGIYDPLGALKRCISKQNNINEDLNNLINELEKRDINKLKPHILKLYKENDDVIVKCTFGNISFLNKYKTSYEKVMDCINKAGPVSKKIRQTIATFKSGDYQTAIIEGIDALLSLYQLVLECKKDIFGKLRI